MDERERRMIEKNVECLTDDPVNAVANLAIRHRAKMRTECLRAGLEDLLCAVQRHAPHEMDVAVDAPHSGTPLRAYAAAVGRERRYCTIKVETSIFFLRKPTCSIRFWKNSRSAEVSFRLKSSVSGALKCRYFFSTSIAPCMSLRSSSMPAWRPAMKAARSFG